MLVGLSTTSGWNTLLTDLSNPSSVDALFGVHASLLPDASAAATTATNPLNSFVQGLEQDWINSPFGQQVDSQLNSWAAAVANDPNSCGLICDGANGVGGGSLTPADGQGGGLFFGNGGNGATDAAGQGGDGGNAGWWGDVGAGGAGADVGAGGNGGTGGLFFGNGGTGGAAGPGGYFGNGGSPNGSAGGAGGAGSAGTAGNNGSPG